MRPEQPGPAAGVAPVRTIRVREDLGGPYPSYHEVVLSLWPDGSVTWGTGAPGPAADDPLAR